MSLVQPGRDRSPGLTLDLASNNPFRNRATSPRPDSQTSPLSDQFNGRPLSRNPFLDDSAAAIFGNLEQTPRMASPVPALGSSAAELFDNLTLEEKPAPRGGPPPRPDAASKPTVASRENQPPRGGPRGPPPRYTPNAPPAAERRAPGPGQRPRAPTNGSDIFADPSTSPRKGEVRRPRRNSDTSIMDKPSRGLLDPEEERRRQRRKDRERRHRKERNERRLDVIDKLDVTSIYGTGLFHHDGPFDACNPHRNRKGSKRAPMQAFPEGSLNNTIGGGGPINNKPDHSGIMGHHDHEAFTDYNVKDTVRPDAQRGDGYLVNAHTRVDKIHGMESMGLGTSTFLEGTPASRVAIQRRESDATDDAVANGGVSRTKSLAQRIRGINGRPRPEFATGRVNTSEQISVVRPSPDARSPGSGSISDKNPFFSDFAADKERKEGVSFVEPVSTGRARAPSSPGERLERRVTTDASMDKGPEPKSMGFLTRMKSLKGGPRRPRE